MSQEIIAVYPGTFDPVTNGHVDVIQRGARLFKRLVVAVSEHNQKQTLFDLQERIAMVEHVCSSMSNVSVAGFSGLLVDCVKQHQAGVLIRGLRAVSDFEYEFQLATMNRRLSSNVETIFLTPAEHNTFLSSTLVREIAGLKGDVSSFVDPFVADKLSKRFQV